MALNSKADYFYSQAAKRDDIVIAGKPLFKRTGDQQRVLKAEDVAWLTEFIRERRACVLGLPFRSGDSIPYQSITFNGKTYKTYKIDEHPELRKLETLDGIFYACHTMFGGWDSTDSIVSSNLHFTSESRLDMICSAATNYVEVVTPGYYRDYAGSQSWTQYLNSSSYFSYRYYNFDKPTSPFVPVAKMALMRDIFNWATGLTSRVFVRDGAHWGDPGILKNLRASHRVVRVFKKDKTKETTTGSGVGPGFETGIVQGFRWAEYNAVDNETILYFGIESQGGDSWSMAQAMVPGLDSVSSYVSNSNFNIWVELHFLSLHHNLDGTTTTKVDRKRLLRLRWSGFSSRDTSPATNIFYPFSYRSSSSGLMAQRALKYAVDRSFGDRWSGILVEFARLHGFDFNLAMDANYNQTSQGPDMYFSSSGYNTYDATMKVVGFEFDVDFKARNN